MPSHFKKRLGSLLVGATTALAFSVAGCDASDGTTKVSEAPLTAPTVKDGIAATAVKVQLLEKGGVGSAGQLSVRLTRKPTADVVVKFDSDSPRATLARTSLTFTPTNWSTAQTVLITPVNNTELTGEIDFHVVFTDSVSSDPSFSYSHQNPVVPPPLTFLIQDDEIGIVSKRLGVATEWGGTAPVFYRLSQAPNANVALKLSSSDTTRGRVSTGTLTFTSSNWNTWQKVLISSAGDTVVNATETYQIKATANSFDNRFNGKTNTLTGETLDDDTDIIFHSSSTNPTGCSTFVAGSKVYAQWKPASDGQTRVFSQSQTNAEYAEFSILHVTIASTYLRTLSSTEIDQYSADFWDSTRRIEDASRKRIVFRPTELVLDRFFDRSLFGVAQCAADGTCYVEFGAWTELGAEMTSKGFNPLNYDYVMVSVPVNGTGGSVVKEATWEPNVNAFSWGVDDRVPFVWPEGRVMMAYAKPNWTNLNWNLWMHEFAHEMEWALERSGEAQMINPDDGWWPNTFGPEPTSSHWKSQEYAILAGYYWSQGDRYQKIPSASREPRGVAKTRTQVGTITNDCLDSATFRQTFRQ